MQFGDVDDLVRTFIALDADLELLSAYIDSQLASSERAALEQRLRDEPGLRAVLDELRATVGLLRDLEPLKPPRSFTLDVPAARPRRDRDAKKVTQVIRRGSQIVRDAIPTDFPAPGVFRNRLSAIILSQDGPEFIGFGLDIPGPGDDCGLRVALIACPRDRLGPIFRSRVLRTCAGPSRGGFPACG